MTIGYNFCVKADARRVKFAKRSFTDVAKDARRASTSFKKEEKEANINAEGQLYGADIAD